MMAGLALLSSLLWGTADFLGGVLAKRFAALAQRLMVEAK